MQYTATVAEDAPAGLFILKISAKDPDVGNNAHITYALYGLGDDRFRLDPYTGKFYCCGYLKGYYCIQWKCINCEYRKIA